jgi:hypothetical protein
MPRASLRHCNDLFPAEAVGGHRLFVSALMYVQSQVVVPFRSKAAVSRGSHPQIKKRCGDNEAKAESLLEMSGRGLVLKRYFCLISPTTSKLVALLSPSASSETDVSFRRTAKGFLRTTSLPSSS